MDPLTIMGIAANVMQIVNFSAEVLLKVKWCLDTTQDAPRALKDIQTVLPTLTETVERAKKNAEKKLTSSETDDAREERNRALFVTTRSCQGELDKLNKLLAKIVPKDKDSRISRIGKGLRAATKDSQMDKIRDRLELYIQAIVNHQTLQMNSLLRDHMDVLVDVKQNMAEKGQVEEVKVVLDKIGQGMQEQPARFDEVKDFLIKIDNKIDPMQMQMLDAILAHVQKASEYMARPTETVEKTKAPVENIPPLAANFVPRSELSKRIEALLSPSKIGPMTSAPTVVLRGMGGQGKTQLTIDYCWAALNPEDFHSVFWVDASSEASVLQSFAEIALKISETTAKFENDNELRSFVEAKLKSWEQPWLLVLDNYDDPTAFKTHIQYFMPQGKSSHFLITSRHSESDNLCPKEFRIIVEGMSQAEATKLFFRRSELPETEKALKEVEKIVDRLEHHALAVDLTGAYFKGRAGSEIFEEYERRRVKIIKDPAQHTHSYRKKLGGAKHETALNIFASIRLSYEQLQREQSPETMLIYDQMLTLFAFLDKQTLSEKVFRGSSTKLKKSKYPEWLRFFSDKRGWDHDIFVDMLKHLQDKLLIKPFTSKAGVVPNINLHPLIKDWLKLRLKEHEQSKYAIEGTQIVQRYLESLQNTVATFDMTQSEKREGLAYVLVCQNNLEEFCSFAKDEDEDDDSEDEDDAQNSQVQVLGEGDLVESGQVFALFFEYMGKIDEARELFLKVIGWRKKVSSNEDTDSKLLTSQSLYTEILRLQKDFKKAKDLDQELYDKRMKLLGEDVHFDLATFSKADRHRKELMKEALWSAHDLGWDLEALGDVEKAEVLQRLAYDGRNEILGSNNALTLQSINNLAHTLRRQGKTMEALGLMQETLRIGEQVFPTAHHSELLQFMSNLQDVLRFQGKLEEAEQMAHRSLKATCDEWGEDHLKAAASRGQLKDIQWDRDKGCEAEKTARDNLKIMENSPYTTDISRIDDIALLLDTLSGTQMTEGGSKRNDILKYAEKAIMLVHGLSAECLRLPSTLQDLIYLATGLEVLRVSEHLTRLEPTIFKKCVEVFGMSDRNSVNSLVRLSSALRVQGRASEADDICQKAIDMLRKQLDEEVSRPTKSTHLAALSWLAVLYKHVGDGRSAIKVYDRAFDYVSHGDFIKSADYETLYSIQGLAEDIDDQQRCQKAEILHKAVLDTRRERCGIHPCVDDSLYAYSWNLRLQDRLNEAEVVCQEALDIAQKFRGPHRNTFCILKRLAYLEEQLGRHELAEKHYRKVLAGFRALGTRHMTRVSEAIEDLQELLMEQRKWREARDLILDAINRRAQGWDRSPGHHAGLIRHLAIVTWELGDDVEGLRLYREARKTYEKAWGVRKMKNGPQKRNLIRRINELLPGTENMEEEMKIEKKESEAAEVANNAAVAQAANDAAAQENAHLDGLDGGLDDGQKTPTPAVVQDLKLGLEQVSRSVADHAASVGQTTQCKTPTESNEEAAVNNFDASELSFSRSSTLGEESFPQAPGCEPGKLDEHDPTKFDNITRQLGQANLNAA